MIVGGLYTWIRDNEVKKTWSKVRYDFQGLPLGDRVHQLPSIS